MAPSPRRPDPIGHTAEPVAAPRRRATAQRVVPAAAAPAEVIVVGCARAIARRYQVALTAMETAGQVVVRAVVDASEPTRAEFSTRFPQALGHASLDDVVAPPDALVILASGVRYHRAQAVAAFKRGWHVLCDPPLAPNARDALLMTAAAQRCERILAVGLHCRFFPAARYLRTLCRDHLLGPAVSFRMALGGPDTAILPPAPSAKVEPPEGVLSEIGVHALDLLTWCLGPATVLRYADDAMGGFEANALIELAFPERVHGTVHLSRDWPTDESSWFVFERAIVRWRDHQASSITVQLGGAPAALEGRLLEPIDTRDPNFPARALPAAEQIIVAQLQNVIAAIQGRAVLQVPADAALASAATVEACYSRRTLLDQPWLTRNEAIHARALALPPELPRP